MTNLHASKKKMIGVIASIFLLSFAVLATTQGRNQMVFAQGNMSENNSMMTMSSSSSSSSLPQHTHRQKHLLKQG